MRIGHKTYIQQAINTPSTTKKYGIARSRISVRKHRSHGIPYQLQRKAETSKLQIFLFEVENKYRKCIRSWKNDHKNYFRPASYFTVIRHFIISSFTYNQCPV